MATGKLLGSGRVNDVYEIDGAWVLRRNREGRGDATAEGAVIEHVRAHGCPVPRVRLADHSHLTEAGLTEARRRRAANPTMTRREIELLGEAEELIRTLLH